MILFFFFLLCSAGIRSSAPFISSRWGFSYVELEARHPHSHASGDSILEGLSEYKGCTPSDVTFPLQFLCQLALCEIIRHSIMHPDNQLEAAIKNGFNPKSLMALELTTVNEPVRTILEKYSNIPASQILQHVTDLVSRPM